MTVIQLLRDEDAALVARCREGDASAYAELFEKYRRKIQGFARKYLGDDHHAEDIVQDVFMQVHRKLHLFRGDAKFSTWLFRVSLNACKSKLHSVERHRRFQPDTYLAKRVRSDEGPESCFKNSELRGDIEDSLRQLSTEHRRVIVMKTLGELSYGEIGEATNQSESQVRGKLYRARKAFRSLIAAKTGAIVSAA